LTWRLAIDQTIRPKSIEPHHPVPNDLQRHAANLGRLGPGRSIVNGRQRQKPSSLRAILRSFGSGLYQTGIKISPKRDRHGEPPSFAMLNQTDADSAIPRPESHLPGFGIKLLILLS
jgi:hypothetical protein